MTGPAADYTRVYTPHGHVAHLRQHHSHSSILCPVVPEWPGEWLGTGNQAEYEKAASLDLCAVCGRLAGMAAS